MQALYENTKNNVRKTQLNSLPFYAFDSISQNYKLKAIYSTY